MGKAFYHQNIPQKKENFKKIKKTFMKLVPVYPIPIIQP